MSQDPIGNSSGTIEAESATPRNRLSLSDQSIFMILANVVKQVAMLAQTMILARLLSQTDLGSFRQVIIVFTLAYVFSYLALPESASYYLANLDSAKRKTFVFQTVALSTLLGLISALFVIVGANSIAGLFDNPGLGALLMLASVIPFCLMIKTLLTVAFVTVGRAKLSSSLSVLFAVANVLSIVAPIHVGFTLESAMIWYTVVHLVTAIIALIYLWIIIGMRISFDADMIRQQFAFSFPFWVSYAVFFGYGQAHKFIVSSFFSPEEFALFSVGATEVPMVAQLAVVISMPLVPASVKLLQEGTAKQVVDLWSKAATKVALVTVPVFMLCVFSPEMILALLYGEQYRSAWPIFVACSFIMILRISNAQSLFKVIGKTHYTLISSVVALVVGIGAGLALLVPLRLLGPVVAILLARVAELFVAIYYLKRHLPINIVSIFALHTILKVAVVAAIACGIAKAATYQIQTPLYYVPINACAAGTIFMGLALAFGVFSDSDKATLLRWATLKPFRS